ncbi:MAG: DUF1911 domain-containing protein [Coprobacillus sp.]|jgi:hypothetical protein|uniref:PoNe immunity protein domain-containing protein n=1 Tax=Thomasclavelia cocleata TaxID=69824 RepID=UPI00216CA283|nr:PoNe immunity protein domain-containing protein [Thomasclavelia cocleata]MCI9094151.1 DUF1911 domain-containing protein [Coprobacillus sp.]
MRDVRKNKAYFENFIEYQKIRIDKKVEKLKEADEAKKQRILVSLTGYEIDLLKAEFSIGAPIEKMRTLLCDSIDVVFQYQNITQDDLLTLLSLSVIVSEKKNVYKLIEKNKEIISNNRLLNYLSSYLCGNATIWDKNIFLPDEFDGLNKVFDENDKVSAMKEYLLNWYDNHSEYAWYNSHLSDSETYCGYWSFEAAAITKILDLKDNNLNISEFYPCIKKNH